MQVLMLWSEVMKLFRPVGFKEMDLMLNTGNRCFPPRRPSQPIFYPVLNKDYAKQIARDWNAKDTNSGFAGYVTEFEVDDNYISTYKIHQAGSSIHQEYWIPSENLDEFNKHISAHIIITDAYYGSDYVGISAINTMLKDKTYMEQFICLRTLKDYNMMDYTCEVLAQWKIITQNYFLWQQTDFSKYGIQIKDRDYLLQALKEIMSKNIKWFIKT